MAYRYSLRGLTRAHLLKRTLVEYLQAARPTDRILLKFGANYMLKGVNPLRQRDLGNLVTERAEGEGASSLHIAVLGLKSVHALYGGSAARVASKPS